MASKLPINEILLFIYYWAYEEATVKKREFGGKRKQCRLAVLSKRNMRIETFRQQHNVGWC